MAGAYLRAQGRGEYLRPYKESPVDSRQEI